MDQSILEKAYNLGFEFEKTHHGCAQCVIGTVYELIPEMRNEDIFRAANVQGGGMGLTSKGQCGATVGAGMLLSQLYGRSLGKIEDPEQKRFEAYRLGAEFSNRFVEKMGSLICGDIQQKKMGKSFNLLNPDDWNEFEKLGGHDTHCPDVVGTAARIVVEMILEQKEKA